MISIFCGSFLANCTCNVIGHLHSAARYMSGYTHTTSGAVEFVLLLLETETRLSGWTRCTRLIINLHLLIVNLSLEQYKITNESGNSQRIVFTISNALGNLSNLKANLSDYDVFLPTE